MNESGFRDESDEEGRVETSGSSFCSCTGTFPRRGGSSASRGGGSNAAWSYLPGTTITHGLCHSAFRSGSNSSYPGGLILPSEPEIILPPGKQSLCLPKQDRNSFAYLPKLIFRLHIDRMKFRRYWSQDYGEDFPGDEKAIQRALSKITVPFNDFEYLPEMLMDKHTADDINRYLDECKKQGISLVTYDALFDKYRDRFDETSMSDAGMLQAYLEHANSDKYYCERNGVVFDRMKTANPADDVRQYLIRSGKPVLFETMCREMPYLDKTMINRVLTGTNSAEFIRNQGSNEKKEYFHADIVNVTEDEMASVVVLIETAIQKHRYISGIEFMDALSNQIPDLVERYPQITPYGWRETFAYKLHGVFSFNGPVISSLQDNFSTSDVYSYFAKSQDRFTLAQLNDLSESLATPIYFDSIYENALRISEEEFVSRKYANFDCDAIDSVLDRFCEGDFIPISHVNIFGSFPDVGFAWNSFLLQHYVADFSKKYCLICNGYTADRAVGTIVKRSSSLSNLEDVLARALAESDVDLTQSAALDFFVEEGYIGRRRLTSINQVMIRANNIRMAKN